VPSQILVESGTIVTFKTSGGTAVLTLTSLNASAGRASASADLGATRAGRYRVRVKTRFGAAPTAGTPVRVYLATSADNTTFDGGADMPAGDGAMSDAEILSQLEFVGSMPVNNVTTAQEWSREIEIGTRYARVVVFNGTNQALSSTAGDHEVSLEPIITEAQ
jgi:hypothetical protein